MAGERIVVCPNCGQKNRVRANAPAPPHCGKCGTLVPWLVDATSADFAEVVEQSPLPTLIDFWAPWCGPCRIIAPTLEKLSSELAGRFKVAKVNSDENPDIASRFQVRGIPTLVLMEGGKEKDRVTGALPEAPLRQWLTSRLEGARTP